MSKSNRKRRKKSNGCLKCLGIFVIVLVVFVGILYGGSFFAWNKYVQPQVGITYNEAWGLTSLVYGGKEKNVVKNPYSSDDLNGFYSNIKTSLFLDDSVNIENNLKDIFNEVAEKTLNSNEDETQTDGPVSTVASETPGNGNSITGNETIDKFLAELKFDFSRLKDYKDEYSTPQILELTDKQTAAFLDDTIATVISSEVVSQKVKDYTKSINANMELDLSKSVRIPQVVIDNKYPTDPTKVALTLTVAINVKDTSKQILTSINKALGFASVFLPKTMYATVTIYPNDYNREAEINLNGVKDQKMQTAYKMVNSILEKQDGQYSSINDILQMVNQKAIEAIEKIENYVPVNFVDSGSVEVQPIKAMMKFLNITEISETQFFCMIRDICLPTFGDINTELGFDSSITLDKVYSSIDVSMDDLIIEIEDKYAVEKNYLKKETLYKQLTTIDAEGDEDCLKKHIKTEQLVFNSPEYIEVNQKLPVTYPATAGIINAYVKENPITSGSGEGSLVINVSVIRMSYDVGNTTLTVVVKADVLSALESYLGADSMVFNFAKQLLPESLYIVTDMDLTNENAKISINGKTEEETKEHLKTIVSMGSAFGVSSLDMLEYDSLTEKVSDAVRKGLNEVSDKMGCKLIFRSSDVLFPSVYEVLATVGFKDVADENKLTPAEIYSILYDMNNEMPKTFADASGLIGLESNMATSTYDATKDLAMTTFIGNLTTQYAITNNDNFITNENVYNKIDSIGKDSELINRIVLKNLPIKTDTYAANTYKVETDYLALTDILNNYISNNDSATGSAIASENYSIKNVSYKEAGEDRTIALKLEIGLINMMKIDKESFLYDIVRPLIPECIYLNVEVNLDKKTVLIDDVPTEKVVCNIGVVGLSNEESNLFLERLIKLGKSFGANMDAFNYDSLTDTLGTNIFNGINSLKGNLGVEISFNEDYCYIPSIYELMANKIVYKEGETNLTDEEVFDVFKELKEIPAKYVTSNKAESIDSFVNEINTKYYINESNKIKTAQEGATDTIINQLTGLSGKYNDAIMGSNLVNDWTDQVATSGLTKSNINLLKFSPIASEGQIAKLFADSVNVTSEGLSNISLDSLYVANETTLTMIFTCDYETGTSTDTDKLDYSNIIPRFIIKLDLDISKINTTEKCCIVTINELNNEEITNFELMCNRLSTTEFTMAKTTSDCDTAIKGSLKDLIAKLNLTLTPKINEDPAKIYIGSIFDITYNNIKDKLSNDYYSYDIADTLAALHTSVVPAAQTNITDADKPSTATSTAAIGGFTVKGSITGRNLGQVVKDTGFDSLAAQMGISDSSKMTLLQSAIISMSDNTYATQRKALTDTINNFFTKTTGDYAILTIQVDSSAVGYSSTLLPTNIYITVVVDLSTCDTIVGYNNLTKREENVIVALAGSDNKAFNNANSAAETKAYLKGLKILSCTFGPATYDITLGQVIASNAGTVAATVDNDKVNGNFEIEYNYTI